MLNDAEGRRPDSVSRVGLDTAPPPSRRALIVATAAAAAVFAAAAAVALSSPRALDERVVAWVAERRSPGLIGLSDALAAAGSWVVMLPVSVVAVVLLLLLRIYRGALLLGFATVIERALNPALKSLFGLPRPAGDLAVHQHGDPGFPSGHAMAAATFCTVLALVGWPTRWRYPVLAAAIAWTVLMGLSRVCLGVHWPTDVIGGWAAGTALACGLGATIGVARLRDRHPAAGSAEREAPTAEPSGADTIRAVLFDWGNTLMVDDGQPGRMLDWPHVEAVPGAAEALAALHERYTLYVATNADLSGEAEVLAALDRVGLARFIDGVFSSRDIGACKPEAAFYAAVLAALRARAAARGEPPLRDDEVLMVGDNYENDVAGAAAAGLRAVWFNPTGRPRPATCALPSAADAAEIRSLDEICSLVQTG